MNNNNNDKIILFEKTPIPTAVMKLSVPTVMASLVMVIYSLADTWFVGMLNDPIENAAVTLAAPVLLAFNAINNLFGVGASSLMGRSLGAKDYDTVKRSSAFGFWSAIISSLIFSLVFTIFRPQFLTLLGAKSENISSTSNYLYWTVILGTVPSVLNVVMSYLVRTEGASLHASIGTMSGCILNIILDPIFVLPGFLNMGAAGAGLATFISNCVACMYFLIYIFLKRKNTYIRLSLRFAVPKKDIISEICFVGIPASIQNLLNVTGMTILNNFTSSFGSDAVAAMGISHKIYMVPMHISWGVTQGIMPLISYNYGSHDYRRARKTVTFAAKISLIFLFAVTVIFYINSGYLITLFIKNENIIAYGTKFLRSMCLALPFICIDFLGVAVYQACGKGIYSLVFAFMRKIVLEIPAIIILNIIYPLYGLAYAQTIAEFILSIIAVITLYRLFNSLEKSQIKSND